MCSACALGRSRHFPGTAAIAARAFALARHTGSVQADRRLFDHCQQKLNERPQRSEAAVDERGTTCRSRPGPDIQHGRPTRNMKTFAIAAIDGYQRFISPYKGFSCAHRVRTGRASCSRFAKRAIARLGMVAGVLVTIRRFEVCAASARVLSSAEGQPPAAAEAPAEACPLWSRWGARKLSGCCACWPG